MEALILRRNYPRPVTFADLRQAFGSAIIAVAPLPFRRPRLMAQIKGRWHAALKSATGATDDVYAVVDGREVHVAATPTPWSTCWMDVAHDMTWRMNVIDDLYEAADKQDYWERPHEVRLDLLAQGATNAASTLGA